MATDNTPIKVPARTHRLIRLGATLEDCTMGEFVDKAVAHFAANHRAELEAGLDHAKEVLLLDPSRSGSHD